MAAIAVAVLGAVPASAANAKPVLKTSSGPHIMRPLGSSKSAASVPAAPGPTRGTDVLKYRDGPVQRNPRILLDFWGTKWTDGSTDTGGYSGATAQAYITAFAAAIGGSSWFASQTQYCDSVAFESVSCPAGAPHVGTPSNSVAVWNDTTNGVVPSFQGVADEADRAAVHFGLPGFVDDTVVVLTPTIQSFFGSGNEQFCGFHDWTSNVVYAYIPWAPDMGAGCATNAVNPANDAFGHGHFDGFSIVLGHEVAEAATDPLFGAVFQGSNEVTFGWTDDPDFAIAQEDADKCAALTAWPPTNVAFGAGSDHKFAVQPLWSNSTDSCPTEDLGGGTTGHPAISSWAADNRDVFVRGFDGALYTRRWNGATWSGWASLGGFLTSDPAAVSWRPDRTDVFARGGDGALWHIAWAGSSWSGWQSLGGGIQFSPAASSWQVNGLDVVAVGLDRAMWHLRWNGSSWSGWQSLGGGFTASPGAVSWRDGSDRVDVFARGQDGQMWQDAFVGAWTGWLPRGGGFSGGTAAASTAAGRLQVYGIGLDGGLWHQSWTGSVWTAWTSLGGAWGGGPSAVSPVGSNTVELAMSGVNRNTERLVTGP